MVTGYPSRDQPKNQRKNSGIQGENRPIMYGLEAIYGWKAERVQVDTYKNMA